MPNPIDAPSPLGRLTVYNPRIALMPDEGEEGRIFYVLGELLMASKHKKDKGIDAQLSPEASPQDLKNRKVTINDLKTSQDASDETAIASARDVTKLEKLSAKLSRKQPAEEKIGSISVSSTAEEDSEETSTTVDSGGDSRQVRRKFRKVVWEDAQLKGICRSFAQKESNFNVYLTKDRALAAADKLRVYDTHDTSRVHAEAPVFKVRATPFKLKGFEDQSVFEIQTLEKVFFLGRSGEVFIEYQEIKRYDRSHTNTDDFVFSAANIQDSINMPVKISQDLKAPIILAVLTFIMQIVQTIISAYLPDSGCSSDTTVPTITVPTSLS